MGRNNADFQAQVLYHGSHHPFEVGDIVEPRSGAAFATRDYGHALIQGYVRVPDVREDLREKGEHEAAKAVKSRVFTVEPLENDDTYEDSGPEVKSSKGFKITGELSVKDYDEQRRLTSSKNRVI